MLHLETIPRYSMSFVQLETMKGELTKPVTIEAKRVMGPKEVPFLQIIFGVGRFRLLVLEGSSAKPDPGEGMWWWPRIEAAA